MEGDEGQQRQGEAEAVQTTVDAGDEPAFSNLKPGTAWGESITRRRAAELGEWLVGWDAEREHGERKGPFDIGALRVPRYSGPFIHLTGADVFWLVVWLLGGAPADWSLIDHETASGLEVSLSQAWELEAPPNDLNGQTTTLDALHLEG